MKTLCHNDFMVDIEMTHLDPSCSNNISLHGPCILQECGVLMLQFFFFCICRMRHYAQQVEEEATVIHVAELLELC